MTTRTLAAGHVVEATRLAATLMLRQQGELALARLIKKLMGLLMVISMCEFGRGFTETLLADAHEVISDPGLFPRHHH